jgi:hypothetical protein
MLAAALAAENVQTAAPIPTVKNVQTAAPIPTVKRLPGILSLHVDGFTVTFDKDAIVDVATLRNLVVRETDNPWYAVVTVLSKCSVGVLTVTRDDNSKGAKSPLARINSAIARAERIRKDAMLRGVKPAADVLNAHKIAATGHKSEKGVWRLVRMP